MALADFLPFGGQANSGSYTPETIARRAKIAEELLKSSSGAEPVRHWTQGANKVAEALVGSKILTDAEKAEAGSFEEQRIAALKALGQPNTMPATPAAPSGLERVTRALGFGGGTDTPAAPPSAPAPPMAGSDAAPLPGATDMVARTAMLEAGNQGPVGQGAVAGVIKNRADQSGMNIPDVVTARNQFEPLNTAAGVAKFNAIDPQSPEYQAAAAATAPIIQGGASDPSGGATHFYAPEAQRKLREQEIAAGKQPRSAVPAWDNGTGRDIGDHRFFNLGYGSTGPNGTGPVASALAPTPEGPPMPPGMPQGAMAGAAPPAPNMGAMAPVPKGAPDAQGVIAGYLNSPDVRTRRKGVELFNQFITKQLGSEDTNDIKEYNQARREGFKGSLVDYQVKLKEAGKPVTNINQQQESSFNKEAGTLQAKRFDKLVEGGQDAQALTADLNVLKEIGSRITTGKTAEVKAALGPYAEALGLKIEGLDDLQAYNAVIARMQPRMRVAGSGATSDYEMHQFLKALPNLGNTPSGNALITQTFEMIQQHKIAAADIGSRALSGEITHREAEKQLRALPDPFTLWKKSKKEMGESAVGAPTQPAAANVASDPAYIAELKKRGLPVPNGL